MKRNEAVRAFLGYWKVTTMEVRGRAPIDLVATSSAIKNSGPTAAWLIGRI